MKKEYESYESRRTPRTEGRADIFYYIVEVCNFNFLHVLIIVVTDTSTLFENSTNLILEDGYEDLILFHNTAEQRLRV